MQVNPDPRHGGALGAHMGAHWGHVDFRPFIELWHRNAPMKRAPEAASGGTLGERASPGEIA